MSGHFLKGIWIEDPKPARYSGLKGIDLINSINFAKKKYICETGEDPDTLVISFQEFEELRYFIGYHLRTLYVDVNAVIGLEVCPCDSKSSIIEVFKRKPIIKVSHD